MESTTRYWCYQCSKFVQISNRDPIACPDCDGGFIEEIDNHHHSARALHADSRRLGSSRFPATSTRASANLRRSSRRNGGGRSPFNPLIVLRGGSATSTATAEENSSVEQNGRGFELYHDDGGGSGLRPVPATTLEMLFGSGFDQFIDQLSSHMETENVGRHEHLPASKTAVEALPTVEIKGTHIDNELSCAVCKEQFELGTKVKNMPCDHLYHSNCILPWLRLRNSCPVCRRELPAEISSFGEHSNSSAAAEVLVGLSIWRLPGGGFAVGRFSGGRRGDDMNFPLVYTEMDGGFSGSGGLSRRVSWRSRERERGGLWGRFTRNLVGFFGGSSSYPTPRLDSRISRSSVSHLVFNASSRRRRGWAIEMDHERRRRW